VGKSVDCTWLSGCRKCAGLHGGAGVGLCGEQCAMSSAAYCCVVVTLSAWTDLLSKQ